MLKTEGEVGKNYPHISAAMETMESCTQSNSRVSIEKNSISQGPRTGLIVVLYALLNDLPAALNTIAYSIIQKLSSAFHDNALS